MPIMVTVTVSSALNTAAVPDHICASAAPLLSTASTSHNTVVKLKQLSSSSHSEGSDDQMLVLPVFVQEVTWYGSCTASDAGGQLLQ